MKFLIPIVITCLSLTGCKTVGEHREAVEDNSSSKLTVGTVQKEIREGMSGAEVIAALGSPNIVSSDENRNEVWVYDKISTTSVYSKSSGGMEGLVLGFGSSVIGGVAPSYESSSGARNVSQNTLTVIIKFDSKKKVSDFSYHTSSF